MQKNSATKWVVFAWTTADNLPKTGDAAQITANVRIDGAAANAVDDVNPTELERGYYVFDITAAECNGDNIVICPASSTAGVQVIGVPGAVWTRLSIPQTGDNYARLGAPAGASVSADVAAVKTDTAAVKVKTDYLPSVTAGANGGVFIAGTNAATTITTGLTTTFTGNLTGSVASVTGAVGSVTGNVGGTVATVTNLTNDYAKYMHGAVWIDTVNGAAGTVSFTNGIMSNPCSTLPSAKTIADNLKLKQFWIQAGSAITLGADYVGYMFNGKGYTLDLGARDISKAQIERAEGLSGTGTTPTGEAVIHYCHLNTISIGEADFNYCHLNGTITMTQAGVPYLFNSCTGVGALGKIVFAAAGQTTVISKWSGALIIAGMVTGNTLYLDGNGLVTLDATNTGGTVYISGNIKLTNSGSGQTIVDTSRFDEDQNITNATGTVNALAAQAKADVKAEADTALADYGALKPTTAGRTLDVTATGAAGIDLSNAENQSAILNLTNTSIFYTNSLGSLGTINANTITFSDETDLDSKLINVQGKVSVLPADPASQSAVETAITAATVPLATSASIAALPTDAQNAAAVLATAALNPISANIKQVNDTTIQGTGAVGTDEWRKV